MNQGDGQGVFRGRGGSNSRGRSDGSDGSHSAGGASNENRFAGPLIGGRGGGSFGGGRGGRFGAFGRGDSSSRTICSNKTEYCHTEWQSAKKKFIWTIDQFSRSYQNNNETLSEIFKAIDLDGLEQEWRAKIYRNGIDETGEFISLYVEFNPYNKYVYCRPLEANLQFAIKNIYGEEVFEKNMRIDNTNNYGKTFGFPTFLKRDILFDHENGLLPYDKLTIVCNIDIFKEKILSNDMPEINVPDGQLVAKIGSLFEHMHLSDCTIISADNKELQVHKCILACWSPVFAAMFAHGTIESQNNKIEIPDFDSNVLKQMIKSMYNENIDCNNIADQLLAVANKYELEQLKAICERELAHSMNVENACDFLILATLYSAEQLQLYAIEYIKKHEKEAKASNGWKSLTVEHFRLLFGN